MKYKICVYAISKNEEAFVERWMNSVKEADMVVVTDTGSTDKTVELLREAGAIVYEETISPWRFDVARNVAMDHIPLDVDICVSNDLDEVFEEGWREKLENGWKEDSTRAKYLFSWSYHPDGTPNKQFSMEKIHLRHGFRWVHPVHEVLEYTGEQEDKTVRIDNLVLNHYPDLTKPRSQYLPLLELSAQENPTDDRTIFWLGREYMYNKEYDKCVEMLMNHLKLPSAKWDEERSASMRFISESLAQLEQLDDAKSWIFKAIAECPTVREPYLSAAKLGYKTENWEMVYAMADKALTIKIKSGSYLESPESWGYALYDFGAIAAYRLGMFSKAKAFAEEAVKLMPQDKRLANNLELIKEKIKAVDENEAL